MKKNLFFGLFLWSIALFSFADQTMTKVNRINNVILVHGAYVSGSSWQPVFEELRDQGFNVWVAQIPEISLKEDVANVNRIIDRIDDDVILVGHSYGGIVITQAGNNPHVKGLVYIAAVVPDQNEKISDLRVKFKAPADDVVKIGGGFQILNPKTFQADFAADVSKADAEFMAYSQVPVAVPQALGAKVTKAAWRYKPSWYLVTKKDRKINPNLLRFMAKRAGSTIVETDSSHAVTVSQPKVVADLIVDASINISQ